ncbi:phage holin family protein [Lacrimispora indolis]|uniref:phage holin family protein n=1 Tax=Lacrimispora indolis TaxID=69825 RepID=UPI00045E6348|nr:MULTISPECIES: phage holin family protein [Lacrimispora]
MELAFRGRYHWTMFLSGGIWDTGIFQKGTETKTNCIRDAVIIGFLPNEFISIVENAGLMGLPLPAILVKAIDRDNPGLFSIGGIYERCKMPD